MRWMKVKDVNLLLHLLMLGSILGRYNLNVPPKDLQNKCFYWMRDPSPTQSQVLNVVASTDASRCITTMK